MTEVNQDQHWKGLSPTAFDRYVDKLSSSELKRMCDANPEFLAAVNSTRDMRKTWGKEPNYNIKADSEMGRFVAAEEEARMAPAVAELRRLEGEHITWRSRFNAAFKEALGHLPLSDLNVIIENVLPDVELVHAEHTVEAFQDAASAGK
jgi:hypothetical protein